MRQEYDDNIFLRRDDRVDDFITRVLPSLHLDYKTLSWDLTSDYTLNWWYYWKMKEGRDSHNLNLTSQVRVIKNLLYLDVSDIYSSVVLNPRRPSTDINLSINRSDSNNANISPYFKYQINPVLTLSTGYRYTNIWYREENGINRQMHTGFVTAAYTFNPKLNTSLSFEYTADRPNRNESSSDNDQRAVFLSAAYTLNPNTNLNGIIGYRWFDFSDGHKVHRPYYSAALTYRFYGTGRIELRASSEFTTSPLFGTLESRTEQLNIHFGETFLLNGSIFHRIDKYFETDRKDINVGLTTGIEYRPQPRLTYKISARYEKDKFLPENEKREIYGASGEISYMLTRKATISLIYNYTKENGRVATADYRDNVAAVQVNITF